MFDFPLPERFYQTGVRGDFQAFGPDNYYIDQDFSEFSIFTNWFHFMKTTFPGLAWPRPGQMAQSGASDPWHILPTLLAASGSGNRRFTKSGQSAGGWSSDRLVTAALSGNGVQTSMRGYLQ